MVSPSVCGGSVHGNEIMMIEQGSDKTVSCDFRRILLQKFATNLQLGSGGSAGQDDQEGVVNEGVGVVRCSGRGGCRGVTLAATAALTECTRSLLVRASACWGTILLVRR